MICKHIDTGLLCKYEFIKDDNVVLTDGFGYTQVVSYNAWLKNYYVIDKFRNSLKEHEKYERI